MTKRIILTTLTIIWLIIIFYFSNQPAPVSSENSNSLIKNTIVKIYRLFNSDATSEEEQRIVEKYDYPVRKTAHFIEYFILGILIYFTFKSYNIGNVYIMIALCFLYACSDEIHQLFIIGRSGDFKDVMIDTFGSITSILILKRGKKDEM